MLKTIARQIPQIDRLVKSRDDLAARQQVLLLDNDELRDRVSTLTMGSNLLRVHNDELREHVTALSDATDGLRQQLRATQQELEAAKAEIALRKSRRHFVNDYQDIVRSLMAKHPLDEGMSLAVGGDFDRVGQIELDILKSCGAGRSHSIIDLGCGSGRLAKYLGSHFPDIEYLGIDVVPELLSYAESHSPPHFRFMEHHDLSIPAPNRSADFVVAFSVFTHLLHHESFVYLREMARVLRPGGAIVFSFLESEQHWSAFEQEIAATSTEQPLTTFIERAQISVWAEKLNLTIDCFNPGPSLWQSVVKLTPRQ